MQDLPTISIVTPNYNYGHFLEATLKSVLDQHYPKLEYIVIDDGSSDDSSDILRAYADRLHFSVTRPNRGQYATITEGFEHATGDVMGWINSDDMHLPWTLRVVGEIFHAFPEVEWISTLQPGAWDYHGHCLGFGRVRGFARSAFLDGRYLPYGARCGLSVPGWAREYIQQESTFWRRSLWEKAGARVPNEYGSAGDFALWCRFYEHSELVGVDVPLAGFRFQDAQQTSNINAYGENCLAALQAFRLSSGWRPPPSRFVTYRTKVWKLPVVPRPLGKRIGYRGKVIRRQSVNSAAGYWELVERSFF